MRLTPQPQIIAAKERKERSAAKPQPNRSRPRSRPPPRSFRPSEDEDEDENENDLVAAARKKGACVACSFHTPVTHCERYHDVPNHQRDTGDGVVRAAGITPDFVPG